MGKCKAKAIHKDLDTFRYNQAYLGIIQAYSKTCVTLTYLDPWYIQNPNIFKIKNIDPQSEITIRILVYSEPRYIQNPDILKIQGLFSHPRCQTSTMKGFVKIVNKN